MSQKRPLISAYLSGFILILIWPWAAFAGDQVASTYREKDFVEAWCGASQGRSEVRQADRTRIDCVTDEYAIEFDFGHKWAEAIGQALFYSAQSGLRPGVVLILKKPGDIRYLARLEKANQHHNLNIQIWVMRPSDLSPAPAPPPSGP